MGPWMSPNHINLYGVGDIHGPKPNEFIGLGPWMPPNHTNLYDLVNDLVTSIAPQEPPLNAPVFAVFRKYVHNLSERTDRHCKCNDNDPAVLKVEIKIKIKSPPDPGRARPKIIDFLRK